MCDNSITYWTQRESPHVQQCSHLDFSRGGAATSLGCTGCVQTQVSFIHKSEPHFIWNLCRSLIQNHTGGFSVVSPLTWTKDSKRSISEAIQKHLFIFNLTIFSILYNSLNSYFIPRTWAGLHSQYFFCIKGATLVVWCCVNECCSSRPAVVEIGQHWISQQHHPLPAGMLPVSLKAPVARGQHPLSSL